METTTLPGDHAKDEEEYVLLDLDAVMGQVYIPPAAPFVLSGLDTLNPVLIIDNKVKLIGEYEETIGTCLVFSESDNASAAHEETEPSEAKLSSSKKIHPIASLKKILKFRLLETNPEELMSKQATT